jgi:hypothetical protein
MEDLEQILQTARQDEELCRNTTLKMVCDDYRESGSDSYDLILP